MGIEQAEQVTQLTDSIVALQGRFDTLEAKEVSQVTATEINAFLMRIETLEQKAVKLTEKSDSIEVLSLLSALKSDITKLTTESTIKPAENIIPDNDDEDKKQREIDSFPMGV